MTDTNDGWEKKLAGPPLRRGGLTPALKEEVRRRIRMRFVMPRLAVRMGAILLCAAAAALGWTFREQVGSLLGGEGDPAVIRAFEGDSMAEQDRIVLKVQEYGLSSFRTEYIRPYIARHPNVEVRMIKPDPVMGTVYTQPTTETIRAFIKEQKPDVLQMPYDLYAELAQEGLLKPLDELIRKDRYDIEGIHDPIVKALREPGGGTLYGLTDRFETMAVYVNKELFEQHDVPLPRDGMTWEELLGLAARFKGTGVAGLSTPYEAEPYGLVQFIGKTEGLQSVSSDGKQATVNTDAWRAIWEMVIQAVREGWVYTEASATSRIGIIPNKALLDNNAFATGKAAMLFGESGFSKELLRVAEAGGPQMDWATVSEPVAAERRTLASGFVMRNVYAITADSAHTKAAWELMKLIGSGDSSRMFSDRVRDLPARESRLSDLKPEQAGAFYSLDVDTGKLVSDAARDGNAVIRAGEAAEFDYGLKLFDETLNGRMTVEAALESLQEKVQTAMLQAESAKGARP